MRCWPVKRANDEASPVREKPGMAYSQGMRIYYLRLITRDFTMWELIEETSR